MQFLHVAAAHHHSGLKCRLPALVEKANYKNALPSNKSWSFLTHVLRHKRGRYKVLIILPFFFYQQLTCMYTYIKDDAANFNLYPPDVLLYYE